MSIEQEQFNEEVPVEEYLTDMEVRMDEKLESFKEELLKAINENPREN